MKHKLILIIVISVVAYSFGISDKNDGIDKVRSKDITGQEVMEHIKYLSSDELEGRFPGTRGDSLTTKYLISEYKKYKLKPYDGSGYTQMFEMITEVRMKGDNKFSINSGGLQNTYTPPEDFIPLGFSGNGIASGSLVFGGYGIEAADQNYNDYTDRDGNPLDVSGKILILMRYSPGQNDPHNNPYEKYESMRMKSVKARVKKAAGIIYITGPESGEDALDRLRYDNVPQSAEMPVINCKREIIEKLFAQKGMDLKKIQKDIDESKKPNSFILDDAYATMETAVEQVNSPTNNILGFLEGSDPLLKNEVIVIGAHKDHLGYGTYGSLYKGKDKQIHNGADDNASGVAGVLELAQKLSANKKKLKRSVLFMCFGAEEAGLIGSSFFTKSDLLNKKKIVAMLNMDMIGRMSDNKLIIYGTGTSTYWDKVLDSLNKQYSFKITKNPEGQGPSDHSSFYIKEIPVLHFFSGTHPDYHSPSDDADKINFNDQVRILNYIYDISMNLNNLKEKPEYQKVTVASNENRSMGSVKVYVGTIPDYSSTAEGFKISGVKEGSPAEKAGLQAEDIIIKFGAVDVKNIYDYMYAMGEFKPGDEAEVVVLRNKEQVTLKVVLGRR